MIEIMREKAKSFIEKLINTKLKKKVYKSIKHKIIIYL